MSSFAQDGLTHIWRKIPQKRWVVFRLLDRQVGAQVEQTREMRETGHIRTCSHMFTHKLHKFM